jgi:hypothetical protein
MQTFGYALIQAVFAATMFYGYHVTKSAWWFWMVLPMACLTVKSGGEKD